jgi:hypothetical protein
MPYRKGRSYRRAARLYRSTTQQRPRPRSALMGGFLAVALALGMTMVIAPHIKTMLSASTDAVARKSHCLASASAESATPAASLAAAVATSAAAGRASSPASTGTGSTGSATATPTSTSSATPTPTASATSAATTPTASPVTSAAAPIRTASATPRPCPSATTTAPAAAENTDCEIIVPAHPLSAAGLATPYQLTGPDGESPEESGCAEANSADLGAFVQATILDPATGDLTVYEPLVVTKGTTPAAAPMVPTLPKDAIVTIDFGFNGTNLTQVGATRRALRQGHCADGLRGSIFGQVSFCNGTAFFVAAKKAEEKGNLVVPSAGVSPITGHACPTTRDFSIVDQDPSDNVTTTYLLTATGQTAQFSKRNAAALPGATRIANGSDNALLDTHVDPALGCQPFEAPDLSQGGSPGTSQALDELSAAKSQAAPVALVPESDPMVLVNGSFSVRKTNLYRSNLGQPAISADNDEVNSPPHYCENMLNIQTPFLSDNEEVLASAASPVPSAGDNLFTFMASRLSDSFANLNCGDFGLTDPVTLTLDSDGVATAASLDTARQTAADGSARRGRHQHKKHTAVTGW